VHIAGTYDVETGTMSWVVDVQTTHRANSDGRRLAPVDEAHAPVSFEEPLTEKGEQERVPLSLVCVERT
jgi:hypothetical protein